MQLPPALIDSLQKAEGFDEEAFRLVHESGEQVTSVRFNPKKIFPNPYSIFKDELEPVKWCEQGFYLSARPSFTLDPLFHAGAYYVQEASSMFVEEILKQTTDLSKPLKLLDLCAAPGGKSTLIQSLITADSLLVSNELIRSRVNVLTENITKWGAGNVVVTNNDPVDFKRLTNYFDVIVVDAPCSGSGLFRKDPAAIAEWSENNVQLCCRRQQKILADIFPSLKEGGILIYSTCSYSVEENEGIADWLVNDLYLSSVGMTIEKKWNIVESLSANKQARGYRFYPYRLKGEGFYISVFRKTTAVKEGRQTDKSIQRPGRTGDNIINTIKPYMHQAENFFFFSQHGEIIAMPLSFERDLAILRSLFYIKKAGIRTGTVIRNDLVPAHELAMSTVLNASIRTVSADRLTALNYLRREELQLPREEVGWALLVYGGLPIGWVKILRGRVNNYYPREWRILNK